MEPWEVDDDDDSAYEATLAGGANNTAGNQEENSIVWCFGKNKSGELSLKHNRNVFSPETAKLPFSGSPVQITSGGSHSAAIDSEGRLYLCGNNVNSKLGLEKITSTSLNSFRIFPQSNKKAVVQVECGEFHTICLLEDGKVTSWGGTLHNKLGNKGSTPSIVPNIGKSPIIMISCGETHSAALNGRMRT